MWRQWLPTEEASLPRALTIGGLAALAAAIVRLSLHGVVGTEFPFLTFFPALLAAGLLGGLRAGVFCLALCDLVAFFFLSPRLSPPQVATSLAAFSFAGGALALVGGLLASTIIRLRETQKRTEAAEAGLRTLVGELAHRNRNGLTVVMAIVSQSARKAASAQDLAQIVNGRLGAMAQAQDEVIRGGSGRADLRKLLERTLSPFDLDRVSFEPSPPVQVAGETAAALALIAHELATNALKYGALSAPEGFIALSWRPEAANVRLVWCERGGPPVSSPTSEGFGVRLLGRVLAAQGGKVDHRFAPAGLECEVSFPEAAREPAKPSDPVLAESVTPVLAPGARA